MVLVERPVEHAVEENCSPQRDASADQSSNEDFVTSSASVAGNAPDLATSNEPPPESDATPQGETPDQPPTRAAATTADATADAAAVGPMSDTVEDLSVYGTQQPPPPDEVPLPEVPASLMSEQPLLPTDAWSSESSQRVRNWLMLGGAATIGILVAVGVFALVAMSLSNNADMVDVGGETPPPDNSASDATDGHVGVLDPAHGSPASTTEDGADAPPAIDNSGISDQGDPETAASEASSSDDGTPTEIPTDDGTPVDDPPMPDDDQPPGLVDAAAGDDGPPGFVASADTAASSDESLDKTLRSFEGLLDERPLEDVPPIPVMGEIGFDETGPKRPAPRVVDVAARLADTFEEIQFDNTPLNDFLRFVANFSTIPITLDPDALLWLDATPQTPVSAHRKVATVQLLVQTVVESVGLTTQVVDDQLLVTLPEEGMHGKTYEVSDLAESDAELQVLAGLVADLVARDSWQSAGGLGSIVVSDEGLTIHQTTARHRQVLRFLEKLRIARGLSPVSSFPVANFDLASPFARAGRHLEKKIAINFFQPTQLDQVTDRLAKIAECQILIDWQSLHQAGWNSDTMVTLTVSDTPLGKVLGDLLEPMGLGYRSVDAGLIQITSVERLRNKIEFEVYPISDLLARRASAAEIIATLREAIGAERFSDRGGPGQLAFDQHSGALLAAFPQENQIVLEQSLAELRAQTPK